MAITITYNEGTVTRGIKRLSAAWTSDGSGDASVQLDPPIIGEVRNVKFIPGSGDDQPTNEYDVTLVDANAIDYLLGLGANLSNVTATMVHPIENDGSYGSLPLLVRAEPLTLTIANAGDTTSGTVEITWR